MKDLNEGMKLIGWPESAQKEFFSKLLPAHAESLKGQPMSELDHNLLVKQLEAIFAMRGADRGRRLARAREPVRRDAARGDRAALHRSRGETGRPRRETAVDWSAAVGTAESTSTSASRQPPVPASPRSSDASTRRRRRPARADVDRARRAPGAQSGRAADANTSRLGFAYQMHLKNEWQKVQLAHVSAGRSFFVFTRGGKHQETISMTSRMLARMCETGRFRAVESAYLMERATGGRGSSSRRWARRRRH